MKQLKPRAVIDPGEAVRIARETAPHQPPALASATQVPVPEPSPTNQVVPKVGSAMLAQRFTEPTLDALARTAKAKGLTQKVLIAQALAAAGVDVHPEDLRDRTPVRRRGG
jgi:hypothetical protein